MIHNTLRATLAAHGIGEDTDRATVTDPDLLTQTEARKLAAALNTPPPRTGLVFVAHKAPQGCWSGAEHGWAVSGIDTARFA